MSKYPPVNYTGHNQDHRKTSYGLNSFDSREGTKNHVPQQYGTWQNDGRRYIPSQSNMDRSRNTNPVYDDSYSNSLYQDPRDLNSVPTTMGRTFERTPNYYMYQEEKPSRQAFNGNYADLPTMDPSVPSYLKSTSNEHEYARNPTGQYSKRSPIPDRYDDQYAYQDGNQGNDMYSPNGQYDGYYSPPLNSGGYSSYYSPAHIPHVSQQDLQFDQSRSRVFYPGNQSTTRSDYEFPHTPTPQLSSTHGDYEYARTPQANPYESRYSPYESPNYENHSHHQYSPTYHDRDYSRQSYSPYAPSDYDSMPGDAYGYRDQRYSTSHNSRRGYGYDNAEYTSPPTMGYHAYQSRYRQQSYALSPVNYSEELPQPLVKGMQQFTAVKQMVDAAIAIKKEDVAQARQKLEDYCRSFPTCHLVWLELARLEMEQGNIKRCREVILKGLSYLPDNDTLLEKRIKVEERLQNVQGVIDCAREFLSMNSPRTVKQIVEAAMVLAKMGYGYEASKVFDSLLQHHLCTQGGVTLDYIRFVFKTVSYERGLNLLSSSLDQLTKHGPMWFFTFSVLEQNHTICWTRDRISDRPNNKLLQYQINQARHCLSDDLVWKVYYIAAQAQLRSFTHIRLWTRMKKRYLKDYCENYPAVITICFSYLMQCVINCPEDYKWKVWLLAGRVQALAGKRKSAIKCLVRSTEIAPDRSTHAVCLELARILDFIGDQKTAGIVIDQNILRFPEEWKLVLERIHQLLRENKVKEAYLLNCEALPHHIAAGRLWSSIIQLTHQIYGSTAALGLFYISLMYVSKAGEVWCEGARVFMNPISCHFNPLNAQRCLNLAVYFTPQYGDSFIEAIRLSMITSDELIMFGRSNNPCFLSAMLTARDYHSIINKCVYSDPNYGSCWFRAKLFPLGSAEEVIFRAIKYTAHEIAIVSNVYYDAMARYAEDGVDRRKNTSRGLSASSMPFIPGQNMTWRNVKEKERKLDEVLKDKHPCGIRNSLFSYAFQPYQMITTPIPLTVGKKLKILFGTSQIEN